MEVYDVSLMVNVDGAGWVQAGKDNFPANGLTGTLPYPQGTGPRMPPDTIMESRYHSTWLPSLVLGLTTAPAAAWLPPALPEFPGFPVPGFPVPSGLAASFHPTEIGDNPYTLNRIPSAVFSTAGYSASPARGRT